MKNFNEIKQHLKELAEIVNMFKSEAVQLRVVELVFGAEEEESGEQESTVALAHTAKRPKRRKKSTKAAATSGAVAGSNASSGGTQDSSTKETKSRKAARPGKGAVGVLNTLKDKGFFKQPQTIRTIVDHSKNSMGLTFKQSDFSGPLVRAVRDEVLVRRKNDDNQYEYTET